VQQSEPEEETAPPLRELDGLIDGDRYFLSPRMILLRGSKEFG